MIYIHPTKLDYKISAIGRRYKEYAKTYHLFADSVEELHKFAKKLNLKRHWFQDRKNFPHYDIFVSKVQIAKHFGAVEVDDSFVKDILKEA